MSRKLDVTVAQKVANIFSDIVIMDVGFSPAVTKAATKQLVNGKPMIELAKSEAYVAANKTLVLDTNALAMKMAGGASLTARDFEKLAKDVKESRTAVCDSCACTMVHYCRENGFEGPLEWVAIRYKGKGGKFGTAGHSIVVGHRAGEITDPASWGADAIIMDLWYWRLGMRDRAIWSTKKELEFYIEHDLKNYAEGLQVKGALPAATGLSGKAKTTSAKGKRCLLATASMAARGLPDDCAELETLRRFRDTVMMSSPTGQRAVAHYYDVVPAFLDDLLKQPDATARLDRVFAETIEPAVDAIRRADHDRAAALFLALLATMDATGEPAAVHGCAPSRYTAA